jgi:hypothetical protein
VRPEWAPGPSDEAFPEERAAGTALRQVIAELSLGLQQAKEELAAAGNVTRLPARPRTGGL